MSEREGMKELDLLSGRVYFKSDAALVDLFISNIHSEREREREQKQQMRCWLLVL